MIYNYINFLFFVFTFDMSDFWEKWILLFISLFETVFIIIYINSFLI